METTSTNRSMKRAYLYVLNGRLIIKECNYLFFTHRFRDNLEAMIIKEREDRIKYHDDHLNPIRAQVKSIQDGLVKEKKDRIAGEKKVLK